MVSILTYLFLSWDADLLTVSFFFHLILLSPKGIFLGTDKFKNRHHTVGSATTSKPFRGVTKVN